MQRCTTTCSNGLQPQRFLACCKIAQLQNSMRRSMHFPVCIRFNTICTILIPKSSNSYPPTPNQTSLTGDSRRASSMGMMIGHCKRRSSNYSPASNSPHTAPQPHSHPHSTTNPTVTQRHSTKRSGAPQHATPQYKYCQGSHNREATPTAQHRSRPIRPAGTMSAQRLDQRERNRLANRGTRQRASRKSSSMSPASSSPASESFAWSRKRSRCTTGSLSSE